jgi:peptide/nickel transport system permease protein
MRVARAATLDSASNDYVEAARALGNPAWRVALRHIAPNILPPVLVQGVVLVTATVYVLLNLVADVLYVLINPRLRGL